MAIRVKLQDVIDNIQMQSDSVTAYLNLKNSEFVTVSEEDIDALDDEDRPSWYTPEMLADIKAITEDDGNCIALPSRFDINDYQIMVDFADSLEDVPSASKLYNALSGKGAFRYFRDMIIDLGLEDTWRKFQNQAYEEIAIEWCKDNGIEYGK